MSDSTRPNSPRTLGQPSLDQPDRRRLLKNGLGAAAIAWSGLPFTFLVRDAQAADNTAPAAPSKADSTGDTYTAADYGDVFFASLATDATDALKLSAGYTASVLFSWGTPLDNEPVWKANADNNAEEQTLQAGMHHGGMQIFPFLSTAGLGSSLPSSARVLLAINHEATDEGLLHPDGMKTWTAEKVKKSQAAHGISIIEARRVNVVWQLARPSDFTRRITASTEFQVSGPAAGSELLKTSADAGGKTILGTLANCASAKTPWDTCLSGEAHFDRYFARTSGAVGIDEKRYGISEKGAGFRWHEFDPRFDLSKNEHEANRFGWMVEFDPHNLAEPLVKRTALGRFKHSGATTAQSKDGRTVVYMTDAGPFEYLYKFVSRDPFNPVFTSEQRRAHLDHGTLYVARLDKDGKGTWLPLIHGQGGLTKEAGFADQAEVLVKTRQAADKVGATKIELPAKSIAYEIRTRTVFCSLGNAADEPFGRIIRWNEKDGDAAALTFTWSALIEAGYKLPGDTKARGTFRGDVFGSPGDLAFDARAILWVATDADTQTMTSSSYAKIGNNQLLAVNPFNGEARRFMTAPKGASIRGICFTPDSASLFINIQHPGLGENLFSDPDKPKAISSWPDGEKGTRPRSATIVIQRDARGYIGR